MGALRAILRYGFEAIERTFDRLFGPSMNPVAQLGALGYFFYWIVAVSGIYLFIFFDTGIESAYLSVEKLTHHHWYHAGVMRSLHRYASDLMVVMVLTHLLREFAYDHYRGARWFSWFTGLPIIWLLYASGITGYWLVWDKLAQYVAVISSELLDWLPLFGEPIARNFVSTGTLTSRFFTLMVFMHVAVPLILLFIMWVHILRISRPKVNPPWVLGSMTLVALVGLSLWKPALSQGPANLSKAAVEVGLDWLYLPLYPLTDIWGHSGVWLFLLIFSLLVGFMPWLPPLRRSPPAVIDLEHCNGCMRCVDDCPYEAIRMVERTDGLPFPSQAQVSNTLCVACGICVGACPASTPFRRTEELRTGIDLPEYTLRELRQRTIDAAAALEGPNRVLVLACEHGGAAKHPNAVVMPCVAMAPPSLVDFIISRHLAEGVVVAGCAESFCFNRLGVNWIEERFAGQRDPYLRARVPRERVHTIWASDLGGPRFRRELAKFADSLANLPPPKKPPTPPSAGAADDTAATKRETAS